MCDVVRDTDGLAPGGHRESGAGNTVPHEHVSRESRRFPF